MRHIDALIASPTERRHRIEKKNQQIVGWLQQVGFSTADVLSELLGVHKNGVYRTLNRLQEAQLVVAEKIVMPLSPRPLQIWGLTPTGALSVASESGEFEYFESGRISPVSIQHSIDIQRVQLRGTRSGWSAWKAERQLNKEGAKAGWRKVPDAIATAPDGRPAAFEIERTAKTLKRYRDIVRDYLLMIKDGKISRVLYICAGNVKADALRAFFKKIEYVTLDGRQVELKAEHLARFQFVDIDTWPECVSDAAS